MQDTGGTNGIDRVFAEDHVLGWDHCPRQRDRVCLGAGDCRTRSDRRNGSRGTYAYIIESSRIQKPVTQKSYDGVITDTRCGAKHSAAIGKTAADCTLVCIHGGEQFALVDGETVYSLEGETVQLKRVAGRSASEITPAHSREINCR